MREQRSNMVRSLSQNIVFDYPTIASLSLALAEAVSGSVDELDGSLEQKREKLISLVDKYTQNIPKRPVTSAAVVPSGKVVLITGGTGSLGSNILAWLLRSDDVSKVYALSRAGSSGSMAKEKHVQAFQREDIPSDLLSSSKVQFFNGDAALDRLGMPEKTFTQVC